MNYSTIVSAPTLNENFDDPNWVILDCRIVLSETNAGEKAYIDNHIANAYYVHLEKDFSSSVTSETGRHPIPDMQKLKKRLGDIGIDDTKQVVAYDDCNGAYAVRAWWQLRALGHKNVAVLDGGLIGWLMHTFKMTKDIPATYPATFEGNYDDATVVTTEQILDNIESKKFTLLDARSPERFKGEEEPIDSVAGHIPHAINRPFQDNLDEKGFFLPAETLKEQFETLIENADNNQIVHMCGSGITAVHNMLAMEIAGFESKVYIGSWSEWIRDTDRPIATETA